MHFSGKISAKPLGGLRLKTFSVLLCVVTVVPAGKSLAQIIEDFSDGDFTANPAWNGTGESFLVNSAFQLQLNSLVAGTSWLYSDFVSGGADQTEWEIFVKQSFAPSGANFGRFYLMSDQQDLSGPLNGYYLQFGESGAEDAVELFRQSGTVSVPVCRATTAAIASAFEIRIKVTREPGGLWQLFADYSGGKDFVAEAIGTDATHTTSRYSGVLCVYTITNAMRFYYDDIRVTTTPVADTAPPQIASLETPSARSVIVHFSEPVERSAAETIAHYMVSPEPGHPSSVVLADDQRSVELSFSDSLRNGYEAILMVENIADLAGNTMPDTTAAFLFFLPSAVGFRDIIIAEIFADPSPQVGLPAAEFVELYNRSRSPVQLDGWHFSDGNSTGRLGAFILLPGTYVIMCSSGVSGAFSAFGSVVSVSNFPTLNNTGDPLRLADTAGMPIDSVHYTAAWYRDEDKAAGGWSLERIDPEDVCRYDLNWIASADSSGGTPGRQNSVHAVVADVTGPKLLTAIRLSDTTVQLVFDERLAAATPAPSQFLIEPPADVLSVAFADEHLSAINLLLGQPTDTINTYVFTAQDIYDCAGNLILATGSKAYLNQDVAAPFVLSVEARSSTSVLVQFSERVSTTSVSLLSNYTIPGWGYPASARLGEDETIASLVFTKPFPNGERQMLTIGGIADRAGNVMSSEDWSFLYFVPGDVHFKDVVFTELLPDPTPPVGLPEAEFVELYNRSGGAVDLSGWMLSDETTSARIGSLILLPGDYITLTASGNADKFSSQRNVLAVSGFPSLNNSGDIIVLRNAEGETMDSLIYSLSWYADADKAGGGWSLEKIDPDNICGDQSNWRAAEASAGGTPGKQNSVFANNPDTRGPKIISLAAVDATALVIAFDEKLEALVPSAEHFTIEPPLSIRTVEFGDAALTSIRLGFAEAIQPGVVYALRVKDIYDCPGNTVQDQYASAVFLLPEKARRGDICLNEVLFNPRPTGVDFVEIFNASEKTIDLRNWVLRNAATGAETIVSRQTSLIPPQAYRVYAENANVLKGEYIMGMTENFLEADIPALNDDSGLVCIIDDEGNVIDSMEYTDKMHSAFIRDAEGVSLERISVLMPGHERSNWRSASTATGFATPGYANSNARNPAAIVEGSVVVEPEIIRPNLHAHDFARIMYRFDRGGYMANVRVFNSEGRAVREIAANELLGTEGFYRWDGDLDDGSFARTGYYMVWFEIFDSDGMLTTFRKKVAVY